MTWWKKFLASTLRISLSVETATPPSSAQKIMDDWNALQYGLRCHMAVGGHKYCPPGLTRAQVELHATGTVNFLANMLVKLRAAEDVITHHGLTAEYIAQENRAQADVEKVLGPAAPVQDQAAVLAAVRAMQKAGGKNGKIRRFPGAGGEGDGVGEGRLHGVRREGGQ